MKARRRIFVLTFIAAVIAGTAFAMGLGMGPRERPGTGGMGGGGGPGGGMGPGSGMGPGGMMGPPPSAGENPLPATDTVIAEGKKQYDANCAVCHGPMGRGDGPGGAGLNPRPPDLRAAASAWSDGQIAAQIQNGRGAMPAYKGVLDSTAIWSIVHYVRRLQRP